MKTLIISPLFVLALASCKKNHSCECVYSNNGVPYNTVNVQIYENRKKAREQCKDLENRPSNDISASCTFK